ncbi:MAG TPA: glycosyltransferase [Chthoniobacterales bacterium]
MPERRFNQYTVPVEFDELRAAQEHIERLEEELLRLKDVKRDLQALKEQHRRLQRSAEGRALRLLTYPWRWFNRSRDSGSGEPTEYERWLQGHRVTTQQINSLREQERRFSYRPLVSILTPTFDPDERFLSEAIESVIGQIYENWELIVVDDGSRQSPIAPWRLSQKESRIQVFKEKEHRGISAALNTALSHASGEWIALLDHDDLLEADALFRVVESLQTEPETDLIYSDEDKIVDGRFASPMFKPDWAPEFFNSYDYLGHLVVMKRTLASVGFRSEFDGAQDYDLLLRVSERTQRIRHIPRILYHWRRTAQSTAHNIRRKPGALEAGRRAVEEHLVRGGENGRVTIDWKTHAYRVRRKVGSEKLTIAVMGGSERDVERIRARTEFPELEVVAAMPRAVLGASSGSWLLFLDHDLDPLETNWAFLMAEQLSNQEVGAVGARILTSTNMVESAGLVLTPDGKAQGAFAGFARDHPGVNRQLQVIRNYSALSASCLLTRRVIFEKIGGFDENDLWPVCAGVNFCLRLRDIGFRTIAIPYAEVRRISANETKISSCPGVAQRWPDIFRHDPFYNPNLSRERGDFSLSISPVSRGKIR